MGWTSHLEVRSQNCERRLLASSCLSVRPHGTSRLPLDGFSWNLIYENISKICREKPSFINICQEYRVLYMKTNIHFWSYLTQFFLEWEMFQTNVVEKIKTHILYPVTFFFWNHAVYEIMLKNNAQPDRPQMAVWPLRISRWVPKVTDKQSLYM